MYFIIRCDVINSNSIEQAAKKGKKQRNSYCDYTKYIHNLIKYHDDISRLVFSEMIFWQIC